jgi:hypothetical protein
MNLVGPVDRFKKDVFEGARSFLPSIQSAIVTIISLGVTASIVFVGCFRLNEDHRYVLRDPAESFLFMETVNVFLGSFA